MTYRRQRLVTRSVVITGLILGLTLVWPPQARADDSDCAMCHENQARQFETTGHGRIAGFEVQIEMPREFVVPGDSQAGAALHLARTVVRRAERLAVRLAHEGLLANNQVSRYLNRLSSLLFVLAIFEDQTARNDGLTLAKSS